VEGTYNFFEASDYLDGCHLPCYVWECHEDFLKQEEGSLFKLTFNDYSVEYAVWKYDKDGIAYMGNLGLLGSDNTEETYLIVNLDGLQLILLTSLELDNYKVSLEKVFPSTPTEIIHKIDGKFLTQADWDQNDETKVDYIKNKPIEKLDGFPQYEGFILENTQNAWGGKNSKFSHIIVPVSRGGIVTVDKSVESNGAIAFLTDYTGTDDAPSYCNPPYNTLRLFGDEKSYTVPDDAKYIYVLAKHENKNALPSKFILNGYDYWKGVRGNLLDLADRIKTLEDQAVIIDEISAIVGGDE
jgi:hypothetical protein